MSKHIFTSQASREMAWDIYGYPKTHKHMGTKYSPTRECGSSNTSQIQPKHSCLGTTFLAPENYSQGAGEKPVLEQAGLRQDVLPDTNTPQELKLQKPTIPCRNRAEGLSERVVGLENSHENKPQPAEIYSLPSHTKCGEVDEENRQALETIAKYTFSFCSPHYIHWLKTKLGQAWMRRQYEQDIL